MAETVEMKIPEDIEFRVIGNAFGLMIASAGLLAGEMLRLRSLDYWLNDIVPLLLLIWMGFRLYRNFLSTMTAYRDTPASPPRSTSGATPIRSEEVVVGQITAKPSFSADKVVEEVAKRIDAKKAGALKKNKFTN